jgi:DNA-cytosine methyltransferase
MTDQAFTGVWLYDRPLTTMEGAKGETVLQVSFSPNTDLADYEWVEERAGYREWLVPAGLINSLAKVIPFNADFDDSRFHLHRLSNVASANHIAGSSTFYEFFCGGGMARAGLGPEWTCLFANDIDRGKAAAYAANWESGRLIVGDVAKLKTADLPGVADLAWASFPCQDLSLAGDRGGLDAARSGSFWPFMKLMHELRAEGRAPHMIVLENVTGLITSHGGKDFDAISNAIEECGYRAGAVVIEASLFVPQSRERVFVVAVDADEYIPVALVADGPSGLFHPPALVTACKRQRDPLWWRLPIPPKRNSSSLTSSKTSRQACAGMTAQRASACSKQRALSIRRKS